MSSARWERLRPQRHKLLLESVDIECRAEALEELARDPSIPGHMARNLSDTANRLKEEATYLRRARRELR